MKTKRKTAIQEIRDFIKKKKKSGGHILDKIQSSKGNKTLVYYRNASSYPSDVKIKSFINKKK